MAVQRSRIAMAVPYFVFAYLILTLFTFNSYFCSSARTGQSHAWRIAVLAAGCTLWDSIASAIGRLAASFNRRNGSSATVIVVSTVTAGIGFASVPFWIYQGYGRFLFENTWADVSCFFTEGYGLVFPIIAAPALAAATLVKGLLVARAQRQPSTAMKLT